MGSIENRRTNARSVRRLLMPVQVRVFVRVVDWIRVHDNPKIRSLQLTTEQPKKAKSIRPESLYIYVMKASALGDNDLDVLTLLRISEHPDGEMTDSDAEIRKTLAMDDVLKWKSRDGQGCWAEFKGRKMKRNKFLNRNDMTFSIAPKDRRAKIDEGFKMIRDSLEKIQRKGRL